MKILQISHSFIPCFDSGGVVRVVYEISKELSAKGHDVTVYTTDGCIKRLKVKKNSPVELEGIRVYYFRNISNWLRMKLKLATPYSMFRVIRAEINDFDVVHIHEHRTLTAVIASRYAKKNKIPYVVQDHGSALPFFQKSTFKKVFDKIWGNDMLKHASKVIALTEAEVEQYMKIGIDKAKIEVVPNGINLSEYEDLPEKGKFRKKYGISSDELIILYLGRLNRIKAPDLLIKSFAEISREIEKVKLVMVGPDDGCMEYLNKLLKMENLTDEVLFTGPLYNKDKLGAYIDADVYVLPSFYETFPNTVIEACACGTPVVITDRCGISDLINDKVGMVVEYDKNSLKEGITRILWDDALREKFESECKDFVEKHFNIDSVIDKLETVYDSAR